MWFLREELLFYLAETGSNIKVLSAPSQETWRRWPWEGTRVIWEWRGSEEVRGRSWRRWKTGCWRGKQRPAPKSQVSWLPPCQSRRCNLLVGPLIGPNLRNIFQRFSENTKVQHEHVCDINTSCLLAKPVSHADSWLDNANNYWSLLSLQPYHSLMQASNFYFFPPLEEQLCTLSYPTNLVELQQRSCWTFAESWKKTISSLLLKSMFSCSNHNVHLCRPKVQSPSDP